MHQVYEKHVSEEEMTQYGLKRRTESTKGEKTSETKFYQNGPPRRSLAPKALTYGLDDINEHEPTPFSVTNQSIMDSPIVHENGVTYIERTTTTTTTTTKTTEKVMVLPEGISKSPYLALGPIDVGMLIYLFILNK